MLSSWLEVLHTIPLFRRSAVAANWTPFCSTSMWCRPIMKLWTQWMDSPVKWYRVRSAIHGRAFRVQTADWDACTRRSELWQRNSPWSADTFSQSTILTYLLQIDLILIGFRKRNSFKRNENAKSSTISMEMDNLPWIRHLYYDPLYCFATCAMFELSIICNVLCVPFVQKSTSQPECAVWLPCGYLANHKLR